MKALSVRQPWAWLLAAGYKDVENRTWQTRFQGRFLIHAGLKWDAEAEEDTDRVLSAHTDIVLPHGFPNGHLGGIVGAAEIYGCTMIPNSEWFVGPFGLLIRNPMQCRLVPCRGKLSFFETGISEADLPAVEP